MLEGFRTYLRAELAKLCHVGDAAALLTSGSCRNAVWLPNTSEDLVEAFGSPEQIDFYLAHLSPEELVTLANCLSQWRGNNVASVLAAGRSTEYVDVPVGSILLSAAEPELKETFRRYAWSLPLIARDPEVLKADAYRHHSTGDTVQFPVCLARPEPGQPGAFRLIDGMHRAIQLVRNGQDSIAVCVVRDP
jgi:hypothetical protein